MLTTDIVSYKILPRFDFGALGRISMLLLSLYEVKIIILTPYCKKIFTHISSGLNWALLIILHIYRS